MTWIDKLKHEWKTVAWGVVSFALEAWDQVLAPVLPELGNVVPPQYQWIVHIAIPLGFFALRQWRPKDGV